MSRQKVARLDLDGTRLDSNDAHAQVRVEVLAESGHTVPVVAARCGGWGGIGLVRATALHDGPEDLRARFETSPSLSL